MPTMLRPTHLAATAVLALALAAVACDKSDSNPAPAAAPAAGTNPALITTAPLAPLTTVIVNKDAVNHLVDASLTLEFAVTGGAVSASLNDFRFQCKRETDTDFSVCPSGSIYRFSALKAATTYQLTVQATSISTGTVATADTLSFTVSPTK